MESKKFERIEPFSETNNVPVVFAINDKFVPYFNVMLESMVSHFNPERNYDVVILHSNVSLENQQFIISQYSNISNLLIRFYDMTQIVEGTKFYTKNLTRLSQEAYYRLYIPKLFSQQYDKVIYLDSDMVTMKDISELADIDLENRLFGAVRDYSGIAKCYNPNESKFLSYRKNVLKLKDINRYFISGLVIFNLAQIRKAFDENYLIKLATKREWLQHDQDVLNYAAKDSIKILSAKWNVLKDFGNNRFLPKKLRGEWKSSMQNPYIIHYGGHLKPWFCNMEFQDKFWNIAVKTPSFESIILDAITKKQIIEDEACSLKDSISALKSTILSGGLNPSYSTIIQYLARQTAKLNGQINYAPKISVIVPVYNAEKTIRRCMDSIINQTYTNLEIIVVNDGSTDNSQVIIDEYAKADARIKFRNQSNGGVANARNVGLSMVTGDYIGWVDSDDYIAIDMYEYLIDGLKRYRTPIVISGCIAFNNNKKWQNGYIGNDIVLTTNEAIEMLLQYKIRSYLHDKLFKADLFKDITFNEGSIFEDTALMHRLFEKTVWITQLKYPKCYHYIDDNSLSHKRSIINKLDRYKSILSRANELWDKFPNLQLLLANDVFNAIKDLRNVIIESSASDYNSVRKEIKIVRAGLDKIRPIIFSRENLGRSGMVEFKWLRRCNRISFKLSICPQKVRNLKLKVESVGKSIQKKIKDDRKAFRLSFKNFLKKVAYSISPSYRIGLRLETSIKDLSNQVKKIKYNNTANELLYYTANAQQGETMLDVKKRVFMSMPKWGGQIGYIQEGNIKLLRALKRICEEHNIGYWILGGTLLGAVRHHGYIPWDDDIDVGMMRNDLEKFFNVMNNYPEFRLTKYYYSKGCWQTAKLTYADESLPFWVDVMCHDYAGNEAIPADKLWLNIQKTRQDTINELIKTNKRLIGYYTDEEVKHFRDRKLLDDVYSKYLIKLPEVKSNDYIYRSIDCFCSKFEKLYPVEHMLPFVEMEFEGDFYPAPKDYDWWLLSRYGNYWELPNDIGHIHNRFINNRKKD